MVVQTKANIAATTHSVESSPENLDTYVVCPGEECTNEKRGAEQASPMQPSCLLSPAKEEAVRKELETHIRDPSHQKMHTHPAPFPIMHAQTASPHYHIISRALR